MWYQHIKEDGKTLTVGSTNKIELPEQGDLSALMIRFTGTPASNLLRASGGKWRVRDYFTDIVLKVNGTAELCHIDARQLAAFHFFDLGIMPFDKLQNYGTGGVDDWLILNFGRKPCDEEVGVQLGNYENPELWLTNNASSSEYSGLGLDLICLMRWKGGQGFPAGYLNKKEFKSWTGVQAETERTKLPVNYPCRRILLQSIPELDSNNLYKTNMFNPMENIKLSFKSGAEIFYDGHSEILARMLHFQQKAYVRTSLAAGFDADKGFFVGIGYINGRAGVPGPREGSAASTYTTIEGNRTDATQKLEGGGGDDMPELMFQGICPENVMGFVFDNDPNPRTWLDLGVEKQVELEIKTRDHADADAGTNYIILERLLPHGMGA
uniref:Uncharacterized protein n=1 Tax=viral metagenome TaxID=1070528 RepID=A0A6H2A2J9_9ZZZZ